MKSKMLVSLMVIVVSITMVIGATFAWFTDSAVSTGNTFTGGTLTIDVNSEDANGNFAIDLGEIANIAPGDVTKTATITIKNTGNLNAATFGRFTLSGNTDLAQKLLIKDYTVKFFNKDGGSKMDYNGTTFVARPDDNFIVNFVKSNANFASNINDWVYGLGPQDIPGAWDIEALRPGEYFTITFDFMYDTAATVQGQSVTLGYEVKATQVNKDAIDALNLAGLNGYAVGFYTYPYFLNQVKTPIQ